jgi:hydrogenase-4 component E
MDFLSLSLSDQGVLLLAALVVFTSFAMLVQTRLAALIDLFAWQGSLLATATALVAYVTAQHHLYVSAALTLALKAILIPLMLRRLIVRFSMQGVVESLPFPVLAPIGAGCVVVFSYYVALPIVRMSTLMTRNTIAVSLAIVLLGMLIMISRRQAMAHVVGFMSIENGLFFAAVASTYGMPMVVELGVAFDVLIATLLFGVFFFEIRSSIDSLDVDRLNRLSEAGD